MIIDCCNGAALIVSMLIDSAFKSTASMVHLWLSFATVRAFMNSCYMGKKNGLICEDWVFEV